MEACRPCSGMLCPIFEFRGRSGVADLNIWWRVLLLDCCSCYLDAGFSYWICWVEFLEDFSVEIYFEHVTLDTLVLRVVAWRNSYPLLLCHPTNLTQFPLHPLPPHFLALSFFHPYLSFVLLLAFLDTLLHSLPIRLAIFYFSFSISFCLLCRFCWFVIAFCDAIPLFHFLVFAVYGC